MPINTNTQNPCEVELLAKRVFDECYHNDQRDWIEKLFRSVTEMFTGAHPCFQANDLKYHDFRHTLQATTCYLDLLAGQHAHDASDVLNEQAAKLGLCAIMLHDTGYLKFRGDHEGTGAKYTYTHVLRSCANASSYLPLLGIDQSGIDCVLGAIRCTGPKSEIGRLTFKSDMDRLVGCMTSTADYLGQLAAEDYPDELEALFEEFEESDNYAHVPQAERMFHSAAELKSKTGGFWNYFVLPKLQQDYQSVYKYLAPADESGPNPYLDAIAKNLAIVAASAAKA